MNRIFNNPLWVSTITDTYHFKTVTLSSDGIPPLAVAETGWGPFGRRGISFPFSDFVSLDSSGFPVEDLIRKACEIGRQRHWNLFELRSGRYTAPDYTYQHLKYITHTLYLKVEFSQLKFNLKKRTLRHIAKSTASGVYTEFSTSSEMMKKFYRIHAQSRKRHGLPPQPFSLFRNLQENFISSGKGFIALSIRENKILSADIFLLDKGMALYKYGASTKEGLKFSSSYKLMWDSIIFLKNKGCCELSLGRTSPENQGLILFKDGWGTEKKDLFYTRIYLSGKEHGPLNVSKHLNNFFRICPVFLLKIIGNITYRFAA